MEGGKRGDLGAHAPQTVTKKPGQEQGRAQTQHRSMMETIVLVTALKTQNVSNHIVQEITFHWNICSFDYYFQWKTFLFFKQFA